MRRVRRHEGQDEQDQARLVAHLQLPFLAIPKLRGIGLEQIGRTDHGVNARGLQVDEFAPDVVGIIFAITDVEEVSRHGKLLAEGGSTWTPSLSRRRLCTASDTTKTCIR